MHLTSYLQDGILTIALNGEIDHHCAKQYIQAITAKIEAYTPRICILDDDWTIITDDGWPAAHFEHTVLVTKEGYEILTRR